MFYSLHEVPLSETMPLKHKTSGFRGFLLLPLSISLHTRALCIERPSKISRVDRLASLDNNSHKSRGMDPDTGIFGQMDPDQVFFLSNPVSDLNLN